MAAGRGKYEKRTYLMMWHVVVANPKCRSKQGVQDRRRRAAVVVHFVCEHGDRPPLLEDFPHAAARLHAEDVVGVDVAVERELVGHRVVTDYVKVMEVENVEWRRGGAAARRN